MTIKRSHPSTNHASYGKSVKGLVVIHFLLICLLCVVGEARAVKTAFSNDFQNFISLVNDRYCVPSGWTVDRLTQPATGYRYVMDFSIALGHALKVQRGYATNNPVLMQRYQNLQREVLYDYLDYVQWRRANAYPNAAQMRNLAQNGMAGRTSSFTTRPAAQAGAAPSVFTGVQSGLELPQKKQAQPGGQVDLLNQKPATDANFARGKQIYNQGVDYWNAGSNAWNAGQQDTAYQYYQKAGEYFQQACNLNFASGCVGNYHYKQGQFMKHFQ